MDTESELENVSVQKPPGSSGVLSEYQFFYEVFSQFLIEHLYDLYLPITQFFAEHGGAELHEQGIALQFYGGGVLFDRGAHLTVPYVANVHFIQSFLQLVLFHKFLQRLAEAEVFIVPFVHDGLNRG